MRRLLFITTIATPLISLAALIVASMSYNIARDVSEQASELQQLDLSAALIATYDSTENSITLSTTEPTKVLMGGTLVFPSSFGIQPMSFEPPENEVRLSTLEPDLRAVIRAEMAALHRKQPEAFRDSYLIFDFAVPIFVDFQTTRGGGAIVNAACCNLVFVCMIDESFVTATDAVPSYLAYKYTRYEGGVRLPSFSIMKWPWQARDSPELQRRINGRRQQQVQDLLAELWEVQRPSNRGVRGQSKEQANP